MICPDCATSEKKLCRLHARTDNLSDPQDVGVSLLMEAHDALESVGRKGHLPCGVLAGKIARFLAQQREPT